MTQMFNGTGYGELLHMPPVPIALRVLLDSCHSGSGPAPAPQGPFMYPCIRQPPGSWLVQEKVQHRSPGESESSFIKIWNSEAKEGPLETGSGGKTGVSGCSPLLPCVQVWWGPLDLRIGEAKYLEEKAGTWLKKSRCWCSLSWGFIYRQNFEGRF